jgi:phospholipid/cholesterol/gamma-HCH transport system ATP-binding protein
MSTPKIRIRGLKKSFGDKKVLDGVDLDVMSGTAMVVIGGSGTGKSVLIKSILGLVTPDAGIIEIDGEDVLKASRRRARELRAQIGMLFQNGALFDSLSVWENVAFGLLAERKIKRNAARGRAIEVLAQVGLDATVADLSPAELSGGMQKRVALARAIAKEPAVIFFDEPTTGLDPIMSDVINKLIVKCVRDLGATAVSITHDMVSARHIADRIAMIHEGRIVWNGPAAEIDRSGNPYVDQFIHGRAEGPISMPVRSL